MCLWLLVDLKTGLFVLVGLLTVAGGDLMTGQIRGSSVVPWRLHLCHLTAHRVQANEFELVLLLKVGQEVFVGDAGQAERKICLAVDRLNEPVLRGELAVFHVELTELVGRPFR